MCTGQSYFGWRLFKIILRLLLHFLFSMFSGQRKMTMFKITLVIVTKHLFLFIFLLTLSVLTIQKLCFLTFTRKWKERESEAVEWVFLLYRRIFFWENYLSVYNVNTFKSSATDEIQAGLVVTKHQRRNCYFPSFHVDLFSRTVKKQNKPLTCSGTQSRSAFSFNLRRAFVTQILPTNAFTSHSRAGGARTNKALGNQRNQVFE